MTIVICVIFYVFIDYEVTIAFITTARFTTTKSVAIRKTVLTSPPVNTPPVSGFQRNFNRSILIVSFMRSGSSFVGTFLGIPCLRLFSSGVLITILKI